jgi:threonine 3-dehydrogenase
MAAARFGGDGRVDIVEVPVPTPAADEVLVKVDSCAICGTDRGSYLTGSDVIPGHEISGTVVDVGDAVDDIAVGAGGVVYLVNYCGSCSCCRSGSTNMCLKKKAMYGFTANGGYAQYTAVRSSCFLPVTRDLPLDKATALLDLLGTPGHAYRRAGRPLRRVAIIGCGPIGVGAIAIAAAEGADIICAIDISDYRLKLAERLGAATVDARQGDPVRNCLDQSAGGFDVVIEAAGNTTTQQQAISLASPGGAVVFVAHNQQPLPIDTLRELIQFEKTLLGSEYFPIGEFGDNYALLESGTIPIDELITHRFSLDRIADAFELFMSGRSGKILVRP